MLVALAQFDRERSAVEYHFDLAAAKSKPMRGSNDGARARAAGPGDAGAAFPYPHAQMRLVDDLHELDIRPPGEQRMRFDAWSKFFDRRPLRIVDEQHAVRIADGGSRHGVI